MVSLWPFKGADTSPESFEKTLSALSGKLTAASGQLEGRRQNSRRFKALWTLYTSVAYLLYVMIVLLVVGWRDWSASEYITLAASPLVISMGRLVLTTFYDYRISTLQSYVNSLQKQRDSTISKLKAATKYDSTQQLLDKYGGSPVKPKPKPQDKLDSGHVDQKSDKQPPKRTGFVPPPTANIPGRSIPQVPQATQPKEPTLFHGPRKAQGQTPLMDPSTSPQQVHQEVSQLQQAEFAPNAFPPQHYAQTSGPKWYDRLMDVLLGEDESNPKNRLALICQNCRLVNGQAPPGVRQLEDVGKWRCSACGTMNGEISETTKLMERIQEQAKPEKAINAAGELEGISTEDEGELVEDENVSEESDVTQYSSKQEVEEETEKPSEPPRKKKGRPKGSTNRKIS